MGHLGAEWAAYSRPLADYRETLERVGFGKDEAFDLTRDLMALWLESVLHDD
jgi:hypothetical protein